MASVSQACVGEWWQFKIRFSQEFQSDSSLFPLQAALLEAVSFHQIPRNLAHETQLLCHIIYIIKK